jgi:hypothetical protein
MATNTSIRFWRGITLLLRLDMAAGVLGAAALLIWIAWH